MGRHARTIRLGRALWESPPLASHVARLIEERFFDDGIFPPIQDAKKAVTLAKNQLEERPAPFPPQNNASRCTHNHHLRPAIIGMLG